MKKSWRVVQNDWHTLQTFFSFVELAYLQREWRHGGGQGRHLATAHQQDRGANEGARHIVGQPLLPPFVMMELISDVYQDHNEVGW